MRKQRITNPKTQQRQQDIIQAALICFDEMGFVDTTIEDIRLRSNASSGSIYHHFKSKDQLGAAIYLEGIRNYQNKMLSEIGKNHSPRGLIATMVEFYFQWMKENAIWARYLMQMRHEAFMELSEGSIAAENKKFVEGLSAMFATHIKNSKIRKLPLELYISLILGPCECYGQFWLDKVSEVDCQLAVKEIIDSAWKALKK